MATGAIYTTLNLLAIFPVFTPVCGYNSRPLSCPLGSIIGHAAPRRLPALTQGAGFNEEPLLWL